MRKQAIPLLIFITTFVTPLLAETQQAESKNSAPDANNLSITVVYDNNPYKEGLETDWGFSCVIKGTEKTILFDTGSDGQLLLDNMSKVDIAPNTIETVVISHIHSDHIGGLDMFISENPDVSVHLPEAFPEELKKEIATKVIKVAEINKLTKICKNAYSTGQMGRAIKEQGLILRTKKGLVVITGCAHPGIFEMVRAAKDSFNEQILLVMGGFHLVGAGKDRIENIITDFEKINVKYAGPCHCSGNKTRALFEKHFEEYYINIGVGKVIKINDLK